jgi:septum formation protein
VVAILLASQSPRRAELLRQLGVPFRQRSVDIDESPQLNELPADYVMRLAKQKAHEGWQVSDGLPTLGSDTIVTVDDKLLGKPVDTEQAQRYLRILSGRSHRVLTSVALFDGRRGVARLSESSVVFGQLSDQQIEAYCATGEPFDKAGGYGIQGMAAAFITRIEGSYSGIMGLPLCETASLLEEFQLPYWVKTE